ncbi:DUF214 family protein [Reticulomyxa filosa]|uniref:DUF214 family protein n=1 Tax=Reticulomyxa filosa TaxID=46433 RepID=X6MD39_RETFI|nr:DUF214 family protein [Reticulomyxa filosa]|eukprot:ETO11352.1 DUF214 family protein [Reticulomyxa filosa]
MYGSPMFCWTTKAGPEFESVLESNGYIEEFTWKPGPVKDQAYGNEFPVRNSYSSNRGKYFIESTDLYPTTPNFVRASLTKFIVKASGDWHDTALDDTMQLFTAAGSQRVLTSEHIATRVYLPDLEEEFLLVLENENSGEGWSSTVGPQGRLIYNIKPMGIYTLFPYYTFTARGSMDTWESTDVCWYVYFACCVNNNNNNNNNYYYYSCVDSIEDLWVSAVLIKFRNNVVSEDKDAVKTMLKSWCYDIIDYRDLTSQVNAANAMLDVLFEMTTYTALFLCLFSLIASMWTNILEQSKEIGILRALGLTNFQIMKIFLYESLVLVLASSLLGIAIGCVMAFVAMVQQSLFSSYPLTFVIPTSVLLAVITGAIATSIISVYLPVKRLASSTIVCVYCVFLNILYLLFLLLQCHSLVCVFLIVLYSLIKGRYIEDVLLIRLCCGKEGIMQLRFFFLSYFHFKHLSKFIQITFLLSDALQ